MDDTTITPPASIRRRPTFGTFTLHVGSVDFVAKETEANEHITPSKSEVIRDNTFKVLCEIDHERQHHGQAQQVVVPPQTTKYGFETIVHHISALLGQAQSHYGNAAYQIQCLVITMLLNAFECLCM